MSVRKLRITVLRLSFLSVAAVAVFVRPSWALDSTTAFLIELAGYLFLLAGLAIRIWCIFYIGGRKSHEIVTQGPYSICRNPLYAGTFLLTIGAGLCFENLVMVALCVPIVLIAHFLVVRMEEGHLEGRFGEEYRRYKQRVPRYWPRLRNYESPETVPISVRAIRRIAIDTAGVLLLPQVEDMLEILHHSGVVPVLWRFP